MQLRLKTKFTLITAAMMLAVVALVSVVYVGRLIQQVLREADDRARFIASQVFFQARQALREAATQGLSPASPSPQDLRDYVWRTLNESEGLTSQVEAAVSYSPIIYEVSVVDDHSMVRISSDASLAEGLVPRRPSLAQLASSSIFAQLTALYGPPQVFEATFPFEITGREAFGDVRVAYLSTLLREQIEPQMRALALLGLGVLLISTLLAAVVTSVTLAPLARISAQLDRIAAGQFGPELDLPAKKPPLGDELGQVSTKITQIGRQLRDVRESTPEERNLQRIQEQRQEFNERWDSLTHTTAGVSHEVKNALNTMGLALANLQAGLPSDNDEARQRLKMLEGEIQRLNTVVNGFRDFMRRIEPHLQETELRELLHEVMVAVKPQTMRTGVETVLDVNGDVPKVRVDRQLMREAVLNVVLNAIEAMPNGGKLTVGLHRSGAHAEIRVSDTGAGIRPEHRDRIFELFYTTRRARGGSGIGLASALKTVQFHHGSIDFTSEVGRGTTFRIELPLAN